MRILYLATGGNIHDYRFLVKLAERGYDTCYAYLEPEGARYSVPGVRDCYLGTRPALGECPDGGESGQPSRRPRSGVAELLKRPLLPLAEAALCRRYLGRLKLLLREFKPDILHAGWVLDAGFIGALSGYRPFLLMPWGSDILLYPDRSRFYRARVRYAARRADMITCDAEEVKRRIVELAGYPAEGIAVFPWGIDLDLFKPDPLLREQARRELGWQDNLIIVMTRSLMPVYGIEVFLRALPPVLEDIPQARVLLAGGGELENKLKGMAGDLGIAGKVRFTGAVSNTLLPRYLNAADLYVSSSLSDGSSLSLLEALACALPVVVTDVPAVLEWITAGENGLVAKRRDAAGLGAAIVKLLKNEALRRKMGRNNEALAGKKADWDKNFGMLEQVYRQLVESPPHRFG